MIHAISTHFCVGHRLTTAWLDKIQSAGFPAVEIFCARQHLDYHEPAQIRELAAWFRDSELTLHSLHAPIYNDEVWGRSGPHAVIDITEPSKAKRIGMVDEIKRALEVAETVPCKYLIQHLGVSGAEYDERRSDAAFSSLDELRVFAGQRGVEVLVENIPNRMSSAEMLMMFLAQTHLNLNFCFDLGHAHMGEGIANAFRLMKDRIRSTHVHDNNGREDSHLLPLVDGGTVDWTATMQLLRSGQDKFPLMLELKEMPDMKHSLESIRQVFEKLESLG